MKCSTINFRRYLNAPFFGDRLEKESLSSLQVVIELISHVLVLRIVFDSRVASDKRVL